ncbi:MAG: DNA polymerase IV [Woeseiaceae bacterium]|nr:DNA polymerase IV [Woeseiaceae bacterium]
MTPQLQAERSILHVDMDAFYASVEQRDNPDLRGKPLVVGGGSNRGVVAAASYEARKFGIRSAMPMRDAMRRCPALVRVHPRMDHYASVSDDVFTIFREFSPLVEGLSLDEAFLDVTASRSLFGSAIAIARHIKTRIRDTTGLTASVGVSHNKLLAKIASDLEKPDGLVVITEQNVHEILDQLPVQVIPGIGRETLARLTKIGIRTIADLRSASDSKLKPVFGRYAGRMRQRACGIDDRPVVASRDDKSISAEETYDEDLTDVSAMNRELLRLAEKTAGRLRARSLLAGTLQVKIRESDFTTFTRQRGLHPPSSGTDQLFEVARQLLAAWLAEHGGSRIRLLGVGGTDLVPDAQQDLFASSESAGKAGLDQAVDQVRERFGRLSLGRARTLNRS